MSRPPKRPPRPPHEPGAWRRAYVRLTETLTRAMHERPSRAEIIDVNGMFVLAWEVYERETMHAAVNDIRAERGLDPVPLGAVVLLDELASGNTDWRDKFAATCACLAVGQEPNVDVDITTIY